MAQAVELLRSGPAYTPSAGIDEKWTEYDYFPEGPNWGWGQSAHGDLGGLRLARGDFVQAFDTLFKGHLWNDAAFVAERVLTTKELKQYVDALPNAEPPKVIIGRCDICSDDVLFEKIDTPTPKNICCRRTIKSWKGM